MESNPVSEEIRKVCSLDDESFAARRKELRDGFAKRIVSKEALADGIAFHFANSPEQRRELEDFVAFERECCSGIDFAIVDRGPELRLEIRGVDADASLFRALAPPATSEVESDPPRSWRRGLKAVGVGSLAGVVVCCVLPMTIAAAFGAAIAAPFATLDQPLIIAASSLGFAAWWWKRGRPNETGQDDAETCGC